MNYVIEVYTHGSKLPYEPEEIIRGVVDESLRDFRERILEALAGSSLFFTEGDVVYLWPTKEIRKVILKELDNNDELRN